MKRPQVLCAVCGVGSHKWTRKCCDACRAVRRRVQAAACNALHIARNSGAIDWATAHTCVDCGAPASDWDHRDYDKPLDVVPVCRRCNVLRGPAKQFQAGARVAA